MRILYYGKKVTGASPSKTKATLLESYGYEPVFCEGEPLNIRQWIRLVISVDLIFYVDYGAPGDWLIRRMKIAKMLRTPLIRCWVGTDVLRALEDSNIAKSARRFDRVVSENVAAAQHLKEELAEIGIRSSVISYATMKVLDRDDVEWNGKLARSVLVYLPKHREEFYGSKILDKLVESRKDLTFYLLANDGERYRNCENVVALGWVDNMEDIYRKVGCLLRITKHDGCPRMVIDSLARGKYVVYSWPFEGCIMARTLNEVDAALSFVVLKGTANHEGMDVVSRGFLHDDVAKQYDAVIQSAMNNRGRKALRATAGLAPDLFRVLVSKCKKAAGKRAGI